MKRKNAMVATLILVALGFAAFVSLAVAKQPEQPASPVRIESPVDAEGNVAVSVQNFPETQRVIVDSMPEPPPPRGKYVTLFRAVELDAGDSASSEIVDVDGYTRIYIGVARDPPPLDPSTVSLWIVVEGAVPSEAGDASLEYVFVHVSSGSPATERYISTEAACPKIRVTITNVEGGVLRLTAYLYAVCP